MYQETLLETTEFAKILTQMRAFYADKPKRYMGNAFEKMIKIFLENDTQYQSKIGKVFLWSEWDKRESNDIGIDLVAEDLENEGKFWAIQCKFYADDSTLFKADIDSFISASAKDKYSFRLVVATNQRISDNVINTLQGQNIESAVLSIGELENPSFQWSSYKVFQTAEDFILTNNEPTPLQNPKKSLHPHQEEAVQSCLNGFAVADRGKLIMACGTGKTFTSLKLMEKMVKAGEFVVFFMPSISLLSQTLREWMHNSETEIRPFVVCSDNKANQDEINGRVMELGFPATTNPNQLAKYAKNAIYQKRPKINVIFSTYHSIEVIQQAQKMGLPTIALMICDEAHRTTGIDYADKEKNSFFTKVHENNYVNAQKRLYMTATPRIYGDNSKGKANDDARVDWLYSMDDDKIYGQVFYDLPFSRAIELKLLSDYKVIILAVDEQYAKNLFPNTPADDAAKIIGCWNGLRKYKLMNKGALDTTEHMRRAVAFTSTIKQSEELLTPLFNDMARVQDELEGNNELVGTRLQLLSEHVDGKMDSLQRGRKVAWLKQATANNECRILTNARCLSEGVDVPALDAVLFMRSRKSVVDVVQAVGRVMRRAPGKEFGYVILPVNVPFHQDPESALDNNAVYEHVWETLQALRSQDDRFNVIINQLELNQLRPDKIQIIGIGNAGKDSENEPTNEANNGNPEQAIFEFMLTDIFKEWQDKIFAKIVLKCGSKKYWDQWSRDVADIATRHIGQFNHLLNNTPNNLAYFNQFLTQLQQTINPNIDRAQAIEMLAQHLITKPVFDALFENYQFSAQNPISRELDRFLENIPMAEFAVENKKLEKFYESVKQRVTGVDNFDAKQKIAIELYDKFFKNAFPKFQEKMGVVYTPIEIVDFILHSANDALKAEFGKSLSDEGVHILDPFTGTGTFITRLLQNPNLIADADVQRKYEHELHANEIALLAYYIASVNIEEVYHARTNGEYQPFNGILLADTFNLNDKQQAELTGFSPKNTRRANKQKQTPIKVIIGNPPYSVGQKSENDNNKNAEYPELDKRISETFVKLSNAVRSVSNYDSYIRSLRWSTDRIGDSGIICFVSNGSWIDNASMDGLRACFNNEFAKIYVFNLRGDVKSAVRTGNRELALKEGGNVFGQGSMIKITITLFIKKANHQGNCDIYYHDIGDYLDRPNKLSIIHRRLTYTNPEFQWQKITPNHHNDWINQRSGDFDNFLPMGDKKAEVKLPNIFDIYSNGITSGRDIWIYGYSSNKLCERMNYMISNYNNEIIRLNDVPNNKKIELINQDKSYINWGRALKNSFLKSNYAKFKINNLYVSQYRPFSKSHFYFDKQFIEVSYQQNKLFPTPLSGNISINSAGSGNTNFSCLITSQISNYHTIFNGQCFPLYQYILLDATRGLDNTAPGEIITLDDGNNYVKKHNITDESLQLFHNHYKNMEITKDDIFYYIYGILHSPTYKEKYQADLSKMLPHIPFAPNFNGFMRAGRALAKLHLQYEQCDMYDGAGQQFEMYSFYLGQTEFEKYHVKKMKFAGKPGARDKSTIIYNEYITLCNIPARAYKYMVNGKSAIEWVMAQYEYYQDKDSGIINDPNDWCTEHNDPKYIFNLLKRIITLSIKTMDIIDTLPPEIM